MRILSLAPSNTEILFALGLGKNIIGVTSYCDYPEEAKRKPKVGSWITTNPERIKELSPDFIFTSYFLPPVFENWQGPGKVIHVAPKTLNEVFESILLLGRYTNCIKKAEDLVQKMKTSFAQLQTPNLPYLPNHPNVYMEEWPARLVFGESVAGRPEPTSASKKSSKTGGAFVSGNWVPELVEIAGGTPIIAKTGKPSFDYKFTSLISSDPDIMIFHHCGFGTRFDKDMIRKRPGWNNLKAVKEDKVFVIDDSLLNRPGPRLVKGAKKIQEILQRYY